MTSISFPLLRAESGIPLGSYRRRTGRRSHREEPSRTLSERPPTQVQTSLPTLFASLLFATLPIETKEKEKEKKRKGKYKQ